MRIRSRAADLPAWNPGGEAWGLLILLVTFGFAGGCEGRATRETLELRGEPTVPLPSSPAPVLSGGDWPEYRANPFVFPVALAPSDSPLRPRARGGIIVHDLDGDALLDFVVTSPGLIAVYDHFGTPLWSDRVDIRLTAVAEREGLPGMFAPGIQAGDPDGDGRASLLFLTFGGELRILDGRTGVLEKRVHLDPPFEGIDAWEHAVLANLRGLGDRDLLLQATNPDGYRRGRYVAAYALDDLEAGPLWVTDQYVGCAHNGLRAVDLDGDGRDEILGTTIFRPDGQMVAWTRPSSFLPPGRWRKWLDNRTYSFLSFPNYYGHLDAIHAVDLQPDQKGLEVVAPQEGGEFRVFAYDLGGPLWERHHRKQECQNVAIGEFDVASPGLEIWCRSRYDRYQKPWVLDARGRLLASWEMDTVAPPDWTDSGVETISAIHWDGGPRQFLAAKERHTSGDVAIIDPLSGGFIRRFPEAAFRLLVADVSGDRREELVVLTEKEIRVYFNEKASRGPASAPRLWNEPSYRRAKMTYNYYSP